MLRRPDEDQLRWATSAGRTIYTFNVGDFCRLHVDFLQHAEEHAGIIVARNQRWSIGEQLRRLCRLMISKSAFDMKNELEHLGAW